MYQALTDRDTLPLTEWEFLGRNRHAVELLRAGILLLKLIDLASSVREHPQSPNAMDALWSALHTASQDLAMHNAHACSHPEQCQAVGVDKDDDAHEEDWLSRLLAPMLLHAMKEDTNQDGQHVMICCDWLGNMTMNPSAVSEAIVAELTQPGERTRGMLGFEY